jgi:D-glycerate 3-kinase
MCGAQGSGKSTLATRLAADLRAGGLRVASLSIDDLYLTHAEREVLGRDVHPLLRTRGVPGTHDEALGLALFDELERGRPALLPRFDKAADDRIPVKHWQPAPESTEVLIFEGWCVGARPEPDEALADPVNSLEREEDAHGIWRRFVNDRLAGAYQQLFGRIDLLVLLAAPSFDVVQAWRVEQEHELRATTAEKANRVMSDSEIVRFIQHYERLTRHILKEMPGRADLVLRLNEDRSLRSAELRR